MEFYNGKEQLYLETNPLGVGLGASLLQVRDSMWFQRKEILNNASLWLIAFMIKSITSVETQYSSTEREALGILHGLEKFHPYCFAHKVSMMTDHKPLVSIF